MIQRELYLYRLDWYIEEYELPANSFEYNEPRTEYQVGNHLRL